MQQHPQKGSLALTIIAHGLVRIASSASGVMIGLYLANLSGHGSPISAGLPGTLGAAAFAAELVFSIPFGVASDAISPRWLMVGGALAGAAATQLFGLTRQTSVFFLSRALEGVGVAAVTPPLLAYLAESTAQQPTRRARAMSYFELSLLAGLALGGLMASEFWHLAQARAFGLVALAYVLCAALLFLGVAGGKSHGSAAALEGLQRAFKDPSVRHLAPVWFCVNGVVGLWLGPTLPFLLTQRAATSQYLDGIYAGDPTRIGWLLLGYSIVFGSGIACWSVVLPRIQLRSAMSISLFAMLAVCLGLFALNHSGPVGPPVRWAIVAVTALLILVESGFTPAALAWLAQSLGAGGGKGAAMSLYSVLLTLGAIGGSLLAGVLGALYRVDGLLLGTALLGMCALFLLHGVEATGFRIENEDHEQA